MNWMRTLKRWTIYRDFVSVEAAGVVGAGVLILIAYLVSRLWESN